MLLIVCAYNARVASSQPTWSWARQAGSDQSFETGYGIATDSSGYVYATGSSVGKSFSVPGFGAEDIFLAKYDANGALLWVVKSGGPQADVARGIAVDAAGFVYVTGYFHDTATFASAAPSALIQQLTSGTGSKDIFIAKYDPSGLLQWVTRAGSQSFGNAEGASIAVDQVGGVYVAGYFRGPDINFYNQPGTVFGHNVDLNHQRTPAIFVAKYKNDGTFVWVQTARGEQENQANGVAVNATGTKVFVTGFFSGNADFGDLVKLVNSNSVPNFFVVGYDGTGLVQWAQPGGGVKLGGAVAMGTAITVNAFDEVYITGNIKGYATFYTLPAEHGVAPSIATYVHSEVAASGTITQDFFVAEYDAFGYLEWLNTNGGQGNDYAYGIAISGSNLLVTGFYELTGFFSGPRVTSAGNFDVFIASYESGKGKAQWVVSAGGTAHEGGRSVAFGPGAIYVTGSIASQPANFGVNAIASSAASEDVFTARLDDVKGPDLYLQDAPNDTGQEPDLVAGSVLWVSPDIWIRNSRAVQTASSPPRYTDEHNHENPEYSPIASNTPWIYAMAHNRGSAAVSGTLHLYWTNASLGGTWPSGWHELPLSTANTITSLHPGDVWVVESQWTDIPNPGLSIGGHFCLLARFVADASTPDPIVGENVNSSIWFNVQHSNNIAWKNVTIVDLVNKKHGEPVGGEVNVGNLQDHPIAIGLSFSASSGESASNFLEFASIEIDLGQSLYQRWVLGGRKGNGVRSVGGTVIALTALKASIGNIVLGAAEQQTVRVQFRLLSAPPADSRASFDFDLVQSEGFHFRGGLGPLGVVGGDDQFSKSSREGGINGPLAVAGGERFTVLVKPRV
ncbi:MAG: SBBP repeat-containing protein [Thermoanaerobaculia bacterium]